MAGGGTIALTQRGETHRYGHRFVKVFTVAFTGDYAGTGGNSLTPSVCGFNDDQASAYFQVLITNPIPGYFPVYKYSDGTLHVYSSAGTETANTVDLTGLTMEIEVKGKFAQ